MQFFSYILSRKRRSAHIRNKKFLLRFVAPMPAESTATRAMASACRNLRHAARSFSEMRTRSSPLSPWPLPVPPQRKRLFCGARSHPTLDFLMKYVILTNVPTTFQDQPVPCPRVALPCKFVKLSEFYPYITVKEGCGYPASLSFEIILSSPDLGNPPPFRIFRKNI